MNSHSTPCDGRRHGIGPDQQRLVDGRAAHHAVGHDGQQQRDGQAQAGHQHGNKRRGLERVQIARVGPQLPGSWPGPPIRSTGRRRPAAAAIAAAPGRGPEEEHADDDRLRRQQQPGQPAGAKKRFSTTWALLLGHATTEAQQFRVLRSGRISCELLDVAALLVAALDRGVYAFLGRLLAGPDQFELLVDDGADLRVVAQAHAARLVGGLADHLVDGHVAARVGLVEAAGLGGARRPPW